MELFIILFIVIIHVILVLASYHSLNGMEPKQRWLFVLIGIGAMYILSTILFAISDMGIDYGNEQAKTTISNLLTFTFVPVNGILILPIIFNWYNRYKQDQITGEILKRRMIVFIIVLIVIFIFECMYMKSIKLNLLEMAKQMIHTK